MLLLLWVEQRGRADLVLSFGFGVLNDEMGWREATETSKCLTSGVLPSLIEFKFVLIEPKAVLS